jgi:uncharacterized membrane protein YfcA
MVIVKKILFVLATTFNIACIFTAIASYFSSFSNGWDAIAAALGFLFFGALAGIIIGIVILRYLPSNRLNQALIISLSVVILLLLAGWLFED